jgi:hypothetical protein
MRKAVKNTFLIGVGLANKFFNNVKIVNKKPNTEAVLQ